MMFIATNVTSIGASHIRVGKECQDFSLSYSSDGYSYAITCDGHGGDNYFRSAQGSRFATQIASSCITELLNDIAEGYEPNDTEEMLVWLEKSIIARWNAAVWEHYEANPFTEEELAIVDEKRRSRILAGKSIESTYGSTLIALAATDKFCFGIQIGDGKCVRISEDGTFDMPIPANDKCFLNSTTSICDSNAIEDFRHFYSEKIPVALFCGSDGIDDSFIRDEQLFKLYATIARSFATSEYEQARAELEDYMPRLSSKGSGDDVSIAALIDTARVVDAIGESDGPTEGSSKNASNKDVSNRRATRVWECPHCGSVCATNFCSECGTKRPDVFEDSESAGKTDLIPGDSENDVPVDNQKACIDKPEDGSAAFSSTPVTDISFQECSTQLSNEDAACESLPENQVSDSYGENDNANDTSNPIIDESDDESDQLELHARENDDVGAEDESEYEPISNSAQEDCSTCKPSIEGFK